MNTPTPTDQEAIQGPPLLRALEALKMIADKKYQNIGQGHSSGDRNYQMGKLAKEALLEIEAARGSGE